MPYKIQQFIKEIEDFGGAAKICGAGAVNGDCAGTILIISEKQPKKICQKFNYHLTELQGIEYGTHIL